VVFCGDVFFEGNIFQNDIDFFNAGFKKILVLVLMNSMDQK